MGALRERNFRLLFVGQSVSYVGNTLVPVALAFAVLDLTHSATDLSYVLAAESVIQVMFLLVGGVVADRFSRRAVMLGSDIARSSAEAVLGVMLVVGHPSVWAIAGLGAVQGLGGALFLPASTGLVPAVVGPDNLQQANQLQRVSRSAAGIAGPALAGVLVVTVGPGWAIILDAASFAVSVGFLAALQLTAVPRVTRRRFLADLGAGWAEVRSRTWLWAIILAISAFNFLYAIYSVAGPVASQRYYGGAASWATVASIGGIGSVTGGLLAMRLRPRYPLRMGVPLLGLFAFTPLAFALSLPIPAIAAGAAFGLTGVLVFNSLFSATMQRQVSESSLSRVSSYEWFGSQFAYPIGLAIAGWIVGVLGVRAVFWSVGLLVVLIVLLLFAVPNVRKVTDEAPALTEYKDAKQVS